MKLVVLEKMERGEVAIEMLKVVGDEEAVEGYRQV